MLVVGEALRELCREHEVTSDVSGVELFSIPLTLGATAKRYRESNEPLSVAQNVREADVEDLDLRHQPLVLLPGGGVIGCTAETISMPSGFLGLVQTKGTIARFLVQATCCDGQVEPGYSGKVTLEIVNFNPRPISIPALTPIAQLFVFKTSPKNGDAYRGRYQHADGPTLPMPVR